VTNITFIFETSPNTKPKEKKVGGTRPPCPPPNCAHGCQGSWWVAVRRVQMGVSIWGAVQLHSEQKGRVSLLKLTFSSRLASLLLRWKTADTVFVVLSF